MTKRLFRWILCIRKCDVGYDATIVRIESNNYTVVKRFLGDNVELITDFRTHPKYGKRLYYAFKPMWWVMHYWDEIFADRYAPQWSYGFSTLTSYPDAGDPGTTTCDGTVQRSAVDESWITIIAGAGNGPTSVSDAGFSALWVDASDTTNQFTMNRRSVFLFDTSSLGNEVTISASVLSLYGEDKDNTFTGTAPNMDIYTSTPASNTTLVNADYSQFGTVSQTGSPKAYSSWSATGYNNFTFNATGIGNVSKTDISKFGLRNANFDVAGVSPTWSNAGSFYFYCDFADITGTSTDPKLVVTYSTVVGPANVKTYMGLTAASVKTVDGLAIASIKTWGGLA